jgi:hypothetical protein
MSLFFEDPLFEDFATSFGLGLGSRGGSEPGEIQATCSLIKGGDDNSWYEAWRATADRVAAAGAESEKAGHAVSARESYLRASLYFSLAYQPLFGAPVEPRLLEAFGRQRSAFERAARLFDPPGQAFDIDFDGARLLPTCSSPPTHRDRVRS